MSATYFNKHPIVEYNGIKLRNLLRRSKILDEVFTNASNFYPYVIQEGERPDVVAYNYYGDSNLVWLILMANDMIDPYYDWYLTTNQFDKFIKKKYGSLAAAQSEIVNYKHNTEGYTVSKETISVPDENLLTGEVIDINTTLFTSKNSSALDSGTFGQPYRDNIKSTTYSTSASLRLIDYDASSDIFGEQILAHRTGGLYEDLYDLTNDSSAFTTGIYNSVKHMLRHTAQLFYDPYNGDFLGSLGWYRNQSIIIGGDTGNVTTFIEELSIANDRDTYINLNNTDLVDAFNQVVAEGTSSVFTSALWFYLRRKYEGSTIDNYFDRAAVINTKLLIGQRLDEDYESSLNVTLGGLNPSQFTAQYAYDIESEKNEQKRFIRLLDKELVPLVTEELEVLYFE